MKDPTFNAVVALQEQIEALNERRANLTTEGPDKKRLEQYHAAVKELERCNKAKVKAQDKLDALQKTLSQEGCLKANALERLTNEIREQVLILRTQQAALLNQVRPVSSSPQIPIVGFNVPYIAEDMARERQRYETACKRDARR